METIKDRTKKQRRKEPEWMIEMVGHKDPWNEELMKYYCYRETVIFPNDLKQFEQLLSMEKTAEEKRR